MENVLDFNTNISLSHEDIIKNSTIIEEGIPETNLHSSDTLLPDADILGNATIIDEGIQESLINTPMSPTGLMQNAFTTDPTKGTSPKPVRQPSHASLTHAEIIKNATIIDEGIKLCPLCRNEVRLFFINFNEKVLMCENFDCDYPFGHEDIIYVKENSNINSNEEVASIRSKMTHRTTSATCSVISAAAWSDIDKINKINDAEGQNDTRSETREYYRHRRAIKKEKRNKKFEDNPKILKEVEAIAKMSSEMKKTDDRCIKNEKWLKNLMNKQRTSGMSLLKPEEINMYRQKKPDLGLGELKIDINPGSQDSNNMSLIKIEIANSASLDKEIPKIHP